MLLCCVIWTWHWVFLEKLVTSKVKKVLVFYRRRRFDTIVTRDCHFTLPWVSEFKSTSSHPVREAPFKHLGLPSDQSCMRLVVRCVMWYDRGSTAHVRHFFVEQIVMTKSQIIVGYFHFRENEVENMKNSYFVSTPFIAGMITTELICFCTSVAIVVLRFVFTKLSFHCEVLLRWRKTVHSSTTSRLQSFFCGVCWLYGYCISMLSTTLQEFYFCVCSHFFFILESLSQCFPYSNFCISTQIQLPI